MQSEFILSNIIIISIAAFFLGLDKGGFRNLSVICLYLMLSIISSKQVMGILAPIYLLGDILPIYLYRDKINYKAVVSFAPIAIIAIIITTFCISDFNDKNFTLFVSIFLILMVIMISISEIKKNRNNNIDEKLKPLNKITTIFLSLMAGITTVSNAAGAITCIYFFRQTKDKHEFVGSTALFFFSLNITKVIIFAFFWKNISIDTLQITIAMLPGLILGLIASTYLIKVIPQKIFNIIVLLSVYYIAFMLFFKNIV